MTIAALESATDISRQETTPPPKLDFLQPSDQPGVLGRFGPYEVIAHVASGGMGIVLKARDPALNRLVALKILAPTLVANALSRARFVREARAAAAVIHENVVPIYAVDECAGLPYLVMQFVHGRPLSERIRISGPLQLEEILRIGAQTAAGLAAAHAQGVIHRDVKPGNILLDNSVERVKLTDFGLVCAADDARLTRTGELAGTPEFMSPEQANNEPVDHRADLFSFGSVLYAMGTGRSPFHATSVVAAIRKVCDARPQPVHEVNPTIPPWLSDLITRLMAKSPDERFQSAREVAKLLEGYLARVQHGELGSLPAHSLRPEAISRRRKLSYAFGVVALLAAVGLLMFALKNRRTSSSTAAPQTTVQSAFAVRDEAGRILGSYADFAEALRVAPPSGILELRWNGPREMPPVTLSAKPLTLRAAAGFHPVWIQTDPTLSAISASAALTVEDIELSMQPVATVPSTNLRPRPRMTLSGIGLIAISNAPLRLSRCVLELPDPRSQPRNSSLGGAGLAVIVLDDVATCDLENTALLGEPWTAVLWRQSANQTANSGDAGRDTRLSLTNCIVAAFHAFYPELAEHSRAQLQMVRCTFQSTARARPGRAAAAEYGPHLVHFQPTSAGRSLAVIASANLFAMGSMLWDGGDVERDALTASMRWQGRENLFMPFSPGDGRRRSYLVLGRSAGEPPVTTLAEWNRFWPEPETDSREVSVGFARPEIDALTGAARVRSAYKIITLDVKDGPLIPPDQWSRFGADGTTVGPVPR